MAVSVINDTRSNQVALALEKEISAGLLVPGRKIPSIRDLACRFAVGQQVVKSATEILENRNLVIRKPRVGIYVNPDIYSPNKKEIGLLRINVADYPGTVLSLSNGPLWENTNLVTRTIAEKNFCRGTLRYELEKLKPSHFDCLLVYIPRLTKENMEEFSVLPFPVIFLGDFLFENYQGQYNQIVEDTADRAVAMVEAAVKYGYREVTMLTGPLNIYYCRVLKDAGEKTAAKLGIKFQYVEFDDSDCRCHEDIVAKHRLAVRNITASGQSDVLLLDGMRETGILIDALVDAGWKIHHDIDIMTDSEMYPQTIFMQSDYSEFSKRIVQLINDMIACPGKAIGRVVLSGLIKRHTLRIDW